MASGLSLQLGVSEHFPPCKRVNTTFTPKIISPTASISTVTAEVSQAITASETPYPWNPLIRGTGEEPGVGAFVDLLRDCGTKGAIREGKSIHGFLLKSDLVREKPANGVVLFNHIANMYSKCSGYMYARRVFDGMAERNVFSWTVMIVASTENSLFIDGFRFFCELQNCGICPDKFAYSAVIQCCIGLGSVELGRAVHAQVAKSEFSSDTFVNTSIINMYAKLGEMEGSVRVFKTMDVHNQVSWNALVSGFVSNDMNVEAFDHFLAMKRKGFEPNNYTFTSILKAVGKLGDVLKGREVHSYVSRLSMESNVVVGTALIDMYSKCGYVMEAKSVFEVNFGYCHVNMPWNAMISGYSQGRHSEEALEVFTRMRLNDVKPDIFTYTSVLNACAALRFLRFGRDVHGMVVKFGDGSRVLNVNNALIDVYAKCGPLEDARKLIERMEERDVVSWTTLLTAYSQSPEGEKALEVFSLMREEEIAPNEFTFASALVSCASLCLIEYGRQVHGLLCKAGFGGYKCVESALIDMYAKCGSIVEAENVFGRIVNPDVVSWTAIISGFAQHGLTNNAIQLFKEMEKSGVKPNAVTILCILFACSHGGLADEGFSYFSSMEEKYGIMPEMEHYTCVVDLFGRVGRLTDAMKFINDMPVEPSEMVWQTLLGACRVHGNVELGEIAAKKILSVRPEYSTTYVLLSNTYIHTGSLVDGLSLRNEMKERGVRKEPGYSWIVVRGRVHKFFSGDSQHPQKEQIYGVLEGLKEKMRKVGYVPDLRVVLQDMG